MLTANYSPTAHQSLTGRKINHNQTEVRVDARLRLGAVQERLQRQGSTDGDVQVKVIEYTVSSTCTPVEAYEGDE